jgi:predicted RNase H-like HicB family nuclease
VNIRCPLTGALEVSKEQEFCSQEQGERLLQLLDLFGVPDYAVEECGYHILTQIARYTGNRNVHHFSHDYVVAIRRLQPEEGGGYMACIPQLGRGAFNGNGDTIEEALNGLQSCYEWLKEEFEDDGSFVFPEPLDEECITFGVREKMSSEELTEGFKSLLLEANRNIVNES